MKTCETCNKKFKPMSRYQTYCLDCFNTINKEIIEKVKGGNNIMLTQTQKEYNKNVSEKTIKEIKEERDELRKKTKVTGWKALKEELVNKIIEYGKSVQGDISNTQLRSIFSGAYFKYNKEYCK
jgi:hypothetical protein